MAKAAEKTVAAVERFDCEQIVESNKYKNRKDILSVLLDPKKRYSLDEADDVLNKFLNGGRNKWH